MNETAQHFLDCYARGTEPDGGWTFGKALQQAQLDYTAASLKRVNSLLDQIKAKVNPEREAFLATPGGRNFCALLAYYLISHATKNAGAPVDWHDTASAQQVLGAERPLPQKSFSRIVAIAKDPGVALMPLGWIEDKLFGDGSAPACADYLAGVSAQLNHAGPLVWAGAARCLGQLASHAMYMVSEGGSLMPTVLHPSADGKRWAFVNIVDESSDSALRRARAALEAQREGPPFAAFACEASVTLPTGRTDAIVIELRCHGDAPLAVTLVFPFRPAGDPQGFAILDSQLIEGTVPAAAQRLFNEAIEAGIQSFNWPSGSWAQYQSRDQHSDVAATDAAPSTTTSEAPAYADGRRVQVGDAVLANGGLLPSRVTEIVRTGDDFSGLRLEGCNGTEQRIPPQAAKETLVFVASEPADFRFACIRWLEQQDSPHAQFALGNLLYRGLAVERDLGRALRLWQTAAESGHAPAEREMGIIYLEGDALSANISKAFTLLRRAADKDDARALCVLGEVHERGQVVPQAMGEAISFYTRSAKLGDLAALTNLARLHLTGTEVASSTGKAVAWLTQAAESGYVGAQHLLATCYQQGLGVPQDYARCVHFYALAAAQGHAISINNLADKYENGTGVAQDLGKALALYREAADKEIVAAWYSLAGMYADGRGVPRDLEQAIRLMKRAAGYDFLDAAQRLRAMEEGLNAYRREKGVAALADAQRFDAETLYELAGSIYEPEIPQSLPIAFELYMHAAEEGHADAQLQVAFRYRQGLGVAVDGPKAVEWYRKAIDSGSPYAAEGLGEMYQLGKLVPRDLRQAAALYAEAVEAGSFTAGGRLAALRRAGVPEPKKGGKPGWKFW
ncbi:tetratricopeptide repeat protein [Variovorax sp. LT1R20]|uniref:tetratricopeptide repeat protein n=1 Tax=Variovorax sp. LT1R20 TaxID=3443729 RepID=UPI003F46EBE2